MSIHEMLNSFRLSQRNLFTRIISLICIVLMVSLFFQMPALATGKSIDQNAGTIINYIYNGVSKACLAGLGVGTIVGGGVGTTGSVAFISAAGVAGTSAADITSGLATIGSIVGGGMAAGVVVSAALPVLAAVTFGTVGCVTVDFVSKNLPGDNTLGDKKS